MKIVFRLIKSIFNIIILSTLIVTLFIWASLSDEKRTAFIQKIEDSTPLPIFTLSQKVRQIVRSQLPEAERFFGTENPQVTHSISPASAELPFPEIHFSNFQIDCGLPEQKKLEANNTKKIYQWRDQQGRLHFGDQSEDIAAQDVSEQYRSREQFFELHIEAINTKLPLFLRDKISVSINKIFLVLSQSLNINQLHHLQLNLKLFGVSSEFQSYLNTRAPNLKGATGLYNARENEAAVLMHTTENVSLNVIRHEASHTIMANLYGITPLWLNEGFAEYFEGLKVSGFETTVYPNTHWLQMLNENSRSGTISLNAYLALKPQQWQGENITQNYALAWSLIYFLLSSTQGKALLQTYFEALAVDRCLIPDAQVIFEQSYPGGLAQLNQDWQQWLGQTPIQAHRY